MTSPQFPREWVLRTSPAFGIAISDCALHCWTRTSASNTPLFGGQTGLVAADSATWIQSRALRPFLGARYEGFAPPAADAPASGFLSARVTGLQVLAATQYQGIDERAIVAPDVGLLVRWDSSEPIALGEGEGWQWRLCDA